jgi:hypothetical protein
LIMAAWCRGRQTWRRLVGCRSPLALLPHVLDSDRVPGDGGDGDPNRNPADDPAPDVQRGADGALISGERSARATNGSAEQEPLMDIARFFTSDACRAAGIDGSTLKNWISREPPALLLADTDSASHVSGRPHLLTFWRVLRIAIMADLVRLAWGPGMAAIAAAGFTDSGSRGRRRGELFPTGTTLLIGPPSAPGEDAPFVKVVNSDTITDEPMIWAIINGTDTIEKGGFVGPHGATVLDFCAIVAAVQRAL